MDDELDNFIRERKARVAEDKASLEHDPPYMEMKARPPRSHVSTAKENIPPKSVAQGREEGCSVGLPLGVEYEKKKQKLQHELRMDYRRFMAQRKYFDPGKLGPLHHLDNRMSVKRDAATLTDDSRASRGAPHLPEAEPLDPEDDREHSSMPSRRREGLGGPAEPEEVEEESFKDELEPVKCRRIRHVGVEAGYDKRRSTRPDDREKRENVAGAARDGRHSTALTKFEESEFATGLIIGAADTEEALQRRKDRYRKELQEQIAEQHRNKKREKDLELKVAATGANDPEKQPDRIRQFGLSRRKDLAVPEAAAIGETAPSSRAPPRPDRLAVREQEVPPPEQPHVAFQSPLLEYSTALGLGPGGWSPNRQPAAPAFPTAMDVPRTVLYPPHPPSLSEAYRSPYTEPHHYYGARNLLDPNIPYYGHLSVPGAGLPVSYWNLPPGGAVSSQLGNHSSHSQHSGSSFPEPQILPASETITDSQVRSFPSEASRSTRERMVNYRDALKQQIQEQQERRRQQREEKERYEAQLEADMKRYQPWGRGGGGAPLRDSTGNLITDLNQMHKLNEEAYSNPEQWQRRAAAAAAAATATATAAHWAPHAHPNDRVSGFADVQTSQFARGKVFASQPTEQQLHEQDKYKAYLRQQIEEKMRKKAEERERERLEEEKEERRLAEQRARIQREYEEEQERKKRKEMEQKAKNEELFQLAEQKRKEAERKKKEAEEKEEAALRQYERERQALVQEVCREPSPPIPTLQKKHRLHQYTPRPPTVDSQHSTAPLSERSLSGFQSPPVPACRNQLRAAGEHHDVFSELSALRRQLRSEQKHLEGRLQQADWEELDSPLSNRHRERAVVDVFDMARLRLQAPVRRPTSKNMEPQKLLRIHDSLQLKYPEGESRLNSSDYPKPEEMGVANRRRRDYSEPYNQFSRRSTVQDDYFDLSPPTQNDYLRSVIGGSARGSLLESESAFIDPLGDATPVPHTPEVQTACQLSARERRRLTRQSQQPQERAASSQPAGHRRHDHSSRPPQEGKAGSEWPSRSRGRRPAAPGHRGHTAGPPDLSDDDSPPSRFSLHNLNHQSSVETVATDTWTRPGTSDTLKCLERPLRRERLTT